MAAWSLAGLTPDDIFRLIEPEGFSLAGAEAVATGFYRKRTSDPGNIRGLPKGMKKFITGNFIPGTFAPLSFEASSDGTVKYLFSATGSRSFETVWIPDSRRKTVCASVQAGCRMGCSFCATASYGFHGNLSAGEIVNQILSIPGSASVTHVVLMGMGEPMDNIDNVLKACDILTAPWGLAISPRNITVSTVGLGPGIQRFLNESECNLALSLLSPFPEERRKMVPAEAAFPVNTLVKMLRDFPLRKKRRVSLAYVMIKGLNDSEKHLDALRRLAEGSSLRINLLPYHQAGKSEYISSAQERMLHFKHELVTSGISASIRLSRGRDISAACGLLASGLGTKG
jgi:23S rRNA (adenine2503-C2)-methyltransferase